MAKPDLDAYRACTQRVSEWFVSTLEPDGTIRGELNLIAYYHAPNLLAACDRAGDAQRMANWLAENALAKDGDFRYQNKKGDIIQPSMQWNYINGWLTWGLARLGRFDLSEPAARFLERFQDASTGGFLTAANPDDGFAPVTGAVDMGSTCAATLGMIYSGRWDAATRAGAFLLRVLDTQGRADSFHCRFRSDGTPITEFSDEQAYLSVVRFEQPEQAYWVFGFAARILALLHRATGRQDFLDGALGYIEVFDRCHEDRWVHWANDKVAWASAALYQTTNDTVHLERVARCFDPIVEAQRDDAVWHWATFFPNYDEQPRGITIELALEFAFLLHEIVSEIDSR